MSKLSPVLKIFAFLPPFLLLIGTVGVVSCGKGLFSTSTATATSSSSSTATPGSMAFVTNFNSGTISKFTRKTTTGKLKLIGTASAGSKKGPEGMAITPDNSYLYAANSADGTVLEYTIGSDATLTSQGSVSDGSGSGPAQIAINSSGTFLWVTNFSGGSISTWSIGSTGLLTSVQNLSGLLAPLGLAVNSGGSTLYVSDNSAGLIYTFAISSTGAISQSVPPVASLGNANGSPGLMTISTSASGTFLYVADSTNGTVTLFNISSGAPEFGGNYPGLTANAPFGIDIATLSSATYVLTANQAAGNTWAFQILNGGSLNTPSSSGSISAPTGLTVDPFNAFAYTANQGDGTVGIFELNVVCPTTVQVVCQIGTVATETNPPSDGSAPYSVVLTN